LQRPRTAAAAAAKPAPAAPKVKRAKVFSAPASSARSACARCSTRFFRSQGPAEGKPKGKPLAALKPAKVRD